MTDAQPSQTAYALRKGLLEQVAEAAKVCQRPRDGLSMVTYDALRQAALVGSFQQVYRARESARCWGTWNGLRVFSETVDMRIQLEALDLAVRLLKTDKFSEVTAFEEAVEKVVAGFGRVKQSLLNNEARP